MHSKLSSFTKRMFVHSSHLLLASVLLLGGTLLVQLVEALTIPTNKATHTTTLSRVILGTTGDQQQLFFDPVGGRAVISGGLVVGEIGGALGNTISKEAINAIIAGGTSNHILGNARNAAIGAGQENYAYASNSVIGAGFFNIVKENAENAFIGGGLENKISAPFSAIGAGVRNIVDAVYSIIPGGIDNTIGADAEYSFAAGQMTNIQHSGTFAWSDDDKQLVILGGYGGQPLTSTAPNTFLIRAKNGLAINTNTVPTGVNVNVGGAVYLGSQDLIYEECTPNLGGTFEQVEGCFFYCDGRYRHTIGLNLQGDEVGGWCREHVVTKNGKAPKIVTMLCLANDGKRYHAGEYLTGYTASVCDGTGIALECGDQGKFWRKGDNTKTVVGDVYCTSV